MARIPSDSFTSEQQAEADRIYSALVTAADDDIRALASKMATRADAKGLPLEVVEFPTNSRQFLAADWVARSFVLRWGNIPQR